MNLTPWERVRKLVGGTGQIIPERRRCVRQKIHAPAFASFDGATGGMILDLSEHGMSMQTAAPLKQNRRIKVNLNLPEPVTNLETTGYIAPIFRKTPAAGSNSGSHSTQQLPAAGRLS
jgi:hypothetical protein